MTWSVKAQGINVWLDLSMPWRVKVHGVNVWQDLSTPWSVKALGVKQSPADVICSENYVSKVS